MLRSDPRPCHSGRYVRLVEAGKRLISARGLLAWSGLILRLRLRLRSTGSGGGSGSDQFNRPAFTARGAAAAGELASTLPGQNRDLRSRDSLVSSKSLHNHHQQQQHTLPTQTAPIVQIAVMSFSDLAGGAACGPSNPLQNLGKRFGQDRSSQMDRFGSAASGSRSSVSVT